MTQTGATLDAARAAKTAALELFEELGCTAAVGITKLADGSFGLKASLRKPPRSGSAVPDSANGVPIRIEVTGRVTKH